MGCLKTKSMACNLTRKLANNISKYAIVNLHNDSC